MADLSLVHEFHKIMRSARPTPHPGDRDIERFGNRRKFLALMASNALFKAFSTSADPLRIHPRG
jgi:hypothetical protein